MAAGKKRSQPAPPIRRENKLIRQHEYLEKGKVKSLWKAAASIGRNGHRDYTMILFAFRHGLRANELVNMLDWHQVNLEEKTIAIRRCKQSKDTEHTLQVDEIAALRKLGLKDYGPIFVNERGGRMSMNSFHKIVRRAGIKAGLGPKIHPHMLRHSCGFDMTERQIPTRFIQEWLGHRDIRSTVIYTEMGAGMFKKVKMW
jgi:type 1 fimbriae regulatory protein FimB/type 1 fimbriae regulatory protein FimE